MEKNTGLSFLIPMWNSAEYIERCLKSFEAHPRAEVVVVDDGSTDNSVEIVKEFIRNSDVDVQLVEKKHSGLPDTRRAGVEVAKYDYIALVDSDDEVRFEPMMELFEKVVIYNTDLGTGRDQITLKSGLFARTRKHGTGIKKLGVHPEYLAQYLMMFHGKIIRKKIFTKFYTTKQGLHEDYMTLPLIFAAVGRWYSTDDAVYKTNRRGDSMIADIGGHSLVAFEAAIKAAEQLKKAAKFTGAYEQYPNEIDGLLLLPLVDLVGKIKITLGLKNKERLIQIIVSAIDKIIPKWRTNPYFLNHFKGYEVTYVSANFMAHGNLLKVKRIDLSVRELSAKYKKIFEEK
jgi:glycosyltransferase involved in cell wall biosynthesis